MAVALRELENLEPILRIVGSPHKYSKGKAFSDTSKFSSNISSKYFVNLYGCYDRSYLSFKEYLEGKRTSIIEYLEYMEGDTWNMETENFQDSAKEISVKEAADMLGVSTKTIRKYVSSNKISSRLDKGPRGMKLYLDMEDVLTLKRGTSNNGNVIPSNIENVEPSNINPFQHSNNEPSNLEPVNLEPEEVNVEVLPPDKPKVVFVAMAQVNSLIAEQVGQARKEMLEMLEPYKEVLEQNKELLERVRQLEEQQKKPWWSRLLWWKK